MYHYIMLKEIAEIPSKYQEMDAAFTVDQIKERMILSDYPVVFSSTFVIQSSH